MSQASKSMSDCIDDHVIDIKAFPESNVWYEFDRLKEQKEEEWHDAQDPHEAFSALFWYSFAKKFLDEHDPA